MEENLSIKNKALNSSNATSMTERLIDVQELSDMLGYDDLRSTRAWCNKNKIPLLTMGKRIYTISNFLEQHMENSITKFVDANYENPNTVMDAIRNNDDLKPVLKTNGDNTKKNKLKSESISNASQRFLNEKK